MSQPEVGQVYRDAKGETYMRVPDFRYPWRFLDFMAGTAEPRPEDFPHKPIVKLVPERDDA